MDLFVQNGIVNFTWYEKTTVICNSTIYFKSTIERRLESFHKFWSGKQINFYCNTNLHEWKVWT